MSEFHIYIPENLSFADYITIVQTARVLADGYDTKDRARVLAAVAPEVTVDYSLIVPAWGCKIYTGEAFASAWTATELLGNPILATQHLLGQPYFTSVSEAVITVQWQQLASHARWEGDARGAGGKVGESSDGRSFMEQEFRKVDGKWKIAAITPSLLYYTGDFTRILRPAGED
ncbi:NTF2-like protein [Aspergillus keveii]|uniref:NTF2-like protein n=1 Tax=Aspergillus keveii TaxID=714993 RepID=A0ABR4FLT4_9EURO